MPEDGDWLEDLLGYLDIQVRDEVVDISAKGQTRIRFGKFDPPPGVKVVISDIGLGGQTKFTLERGDAERPPDAIELQLASDLDTLQLTNASGFGLVSVVGPENASKSVNVTAEGADTLPDNFTLKSGRFQLKPRYAPPHLFLNQAKVTNESQGNLGIVEVIGDCTLPKHVGIAQLRIHPTSQIYVPPDTSVTDVESATSSNLDFALSGTLKAGLPSESVITLVGPYALLIVPTGRTTRNVRVRGSGTVRVEGAIIDSSFDPENESHLKLDVAGSATGVSGEVWLQVSAGAVVLGSDSDPLRVRRILELDSGEVEGVSLYDLDNLANLAELRKLARFSLWLGDRKEAKTLPGRMTLGGGQERTVRQKRSHFWASLVEILGDGHATGRVQSIARRNAMRFRREHLDPGTEKVLLIMYSWVGYGERILQPLVAIPLFAALVTPFLMQPPMTTDEFCCGRLSDYGDTFASLLLAPLAFFRTPVDLPEGVHGPLETSLLVAFQILSLLLLFFALSAIRRITKAE